MRIGFITMVLALSCGSASAVDGTNLPGRDYANFPAPSAFVCRTTCGGEAQCQAYTFVKPGIQGPTGHCWLKSALPAIVKDPCCDSGPRSFISRRDLMRGEGGMNRPGLDFGNFTTASWNSCQAACEANGTCRSWSYVRPGVQGPAGRCWLKNAVARPVADANVVSGVKYRAPSVLFDDSQ